MVYYITWWQRKSEGDAKGSLEPSRLEICRKKSDVIVTEELKYLRLIVKKTYLRLFMCPWTTEDRRKKKDDRRQKKEELIVSEVFYTVNWVFHLDRCDSDLCYLYAKYCMYMYVSVFTLCAKFGSFQCQIERCDHTRN